MIYEFFDKGSKTTITFYLDLFDSDTYAPREIMIYDGDYLLYEGQERFYNYTNRSKSFKYDFPHEGKYKIIFGNDPKGYGLHYWPSMTINIDKSSNNFSTEISIRRKEDAVVYGYRRDTSIANEGRITYNDGWGYNGESGGFLENRNFISASSAKDLITFGSWKNVITNLVSPVKVPTSKLNENSNDDKVEVLDFSTINTLASFTTANSGYDFFVRFSNDLRYVRRDQRGKYQYVYFSNYPFDGFNADAFTGEDGKIRDYLFVGMFLAFYNTTTGVYEINGNSRNGTINRTIEQIYDACKKSRDQGNPYWPISYAQYSYIRDLLVMFAQSDNLQEAYGQGRCSNGVVKNDGTKINDYFYNSGSSANSVYVLGMQDLWGNAWQFISGLALSYNDYVGKAYPPFNASATGYEPCGTSISPLSVTNKIISTGEIDSKFDWWLPTVSEGTYNGVTTGINTYYCNTLTFNLAAPLILIGVGGANNITAGYNGMYRLGASTTAPTTALTNVGVRIAFVLDSSE